MFGTDGHPQQVNPLLLRQLWHVYNTDPIIRAGRSVIINHLSRDTLRFTRGGRPVKISRSMTMVLETAWQRFIEDALDCAFVFGVVPWYTIKHPVQIAVPVCPSPGTYVMEVCNAGLRTETTARPNMPDEKQKINVFNGFGWNITQEGLPTSPIITMLPIINVQREMIDIGLRADALAGNPAIVTTQKSRSVNTVNAEEFDVFANADAMHVRAEDRFRLDRLAVEEVVGQRAVYENFKAALETNNAEMMHQKKAQDARQMFPLPIDHEIQRQIPASSNSKLIESISMFQETQCAMLGIPRSYLLGTKGSSISTKAIAAQNTSQLDSTIQWWRRSLSELLTVVYIDIYGTMDASAVAAERGKSKRKFNPQEALEDNFVSIQFTPDVLGGPESLLQLYRTGVINYETYGAP